MDCPARQRVIILRLLATGPTTNRGMRAQTGASEDVTRVRLTELVRAGRVETWFANAHGQRVRVYALPGVRPPANWGPSWFESLGWESPL